VEVYWDGEGFTVELYQQPAEVSVRDYQQDGRLPPFRVAEEAKIWFNS